MKLRYLFVDRFGRLVKARRLLVERLWQGDYGVDRLARATGTQARLTELKLVSVLCDGLLQPLQIFLLRLPLSDGRFTDRDYHTLQGFTDPDCMTAREMISHHTAGWPPDFFHQLAVAMDVARRDLEVPVGIGGPLMMAAALETSPTEALKYLR